MTACCNKSSSRRVSSSSDSTPSAIAIRRSEPIILVSTGNGVPVCSNNSALPPSGCLDMRSVISAISYTGSTGTLTRCNSPSRSRRAINSLRLRYINPYIDSAPKFSRHTKLKNNPANPPDYPDYRSRPQKRQAEATTAGTAAPGTWAAATSGRPRSPPACRYGGGFRRRKPTRYRGRRSPFRASAQSCWPSCARRSFRP